MAVEDSSNEQRKFDPLHGVTLAMMLERLKNSYGWDELGRAIRINCFNFDPSIKSSLKFLRRTPWARAKVEKFYLAAVRDNKIAFPSERREHE